MAMLGAKRNTKRKTDEEIEKRKPYIQSKARKQGVVSRFSPSAPRFAKTLADGGSLQFGARESFEELEIETNQSDGEKGPRSRGD